MNRKGFLILIGLLSTSCTVWSEDCAKLQAELRNSLAKNEFDASESLFPKIEQACTQGTFLGEKMLFSRMLAKSAKALVGQGKLEQAEALLNRVNALPWSVNGVRGDIAAKRKDWKEAAQQYHRAFEQLSDSPPLDEHQTLEKTKRWMYQLASEAQLIAEKVDVITDREGNEKILLGERDIQVEESIPVKFDTNSAELTSDGRDSADKLVKSLLGQNQLKQIAVIGHTDERGTDAYNLTLSQRRAETVANYLVANHITVPIKSIGKGESAPKAISDESRYTQEEKWAIQRRVEIETLP